MTVFHSYVLVYIVG